jgi:aspartyl-tRNA synthetase
MLQIRSISNDLLFIPLRDAYGTTQLVFRTEICASPSAADALREKINALTPESVICIKGTVRNRPDGMTNKELETGEIEVEVNDVLCLNTAATNLPFLPGKQKLVSHSLPFISQYTALNSDLELSGSQRRKSE